MAAALFEEKRPFTSSALWACAVYSLVPFVGVVFVPFILALAALALVRGERGVLRPLAFGLLILAVQVVLWWLLYAVPTWGIRV